MVTKSWHDKSREKRRYWQAHIQAWKKSGLWQKEYCRRHNLSKHCFGYWKRKFAAEATGATTARFVSLPVVVGQAGVDTGLTIHLGNITIKVASGFNPEELSRAVHAMGGRP